MTFESSRDASSASLVTFNQPRDSIGESRGLSSRVALRGLDAIDTPLVSLVTSYWSRGTPRARLVISYRRS